MIFIQTATLMSPICELKKTYQSKKLVFQKIVPLKNFNPFHTTNLFLYSLKTWENLWFSDIFGGIERDQWHEMGWYKKKVIKNKWYVILSDSHIYWFTCKSNTFIHEILLLAFFHRNIQASLCFKGEQKDLY